jgi:hypothetical protein
MKIEFLTLFLIISLTGPAWARLGESEDQLVLRYGDATNKEHLAASDSELVEVDRLHFKKTGFDVVVTLFNSVSSEEVITNSESDSLSDQEIKTLLDANADGHAWKEMPASQGTVPWPEDDGTRSDVGGHKLWQRDDGAVAIAGGDEFKIKSKELIDAEVAAYKVAHTHSLDGF